MNKLSTACLTLLVSVVPVLASNSSANAIPLNPSHREYLRPENQGRNSYRNNWERAIRRGIIDRPSRVRNSNEAWQLFLEAARNGDRYNATRRLGQYLVIYSEIYGVYAALEEEQRINRVLLRRTDRDIRQLYPLFNRIFPISTPPYEQDAPY
ncbi:MAG: hypothetical protein KME64_26785 [Scytonematopsis contorta HA4267-MV1]|jgi:hypothetical protein|nr:hypothetical protein [Scytonematopsis contorta HA4267-MV1]